MLPATNSPASATHPRIREAQRKAVDRWGAGLGSVRFICGTQEIHRELEAEIASFFGCDDAILYMTCWAANEGLFATVLEEADGLYSDELNHASIIDGVRLCKAKRYRTPHGDLAALEKMLGEDATSRYKLYMTDGVFSMEGEEQDLAECVRICEATGTLLTVDWPALGLPRDVIKGGVLACGMYDLKPVRLSKRSEYVKFTDEIEQELSAQRHIDRLHCPVTLIYGTQESPEFQRQSRDFAEAVRAAGKPVTLIRADHSNHFEIPETLGNPYGIFGRAVLEQMGLA